MAGYRELKRLKERYSLLEEWYGSEFAMTEFAAPSHTPQARSIGDLLPEVLKEVRSPEAGKLLQLQNVWEDIIGSAFAKYASPGYFKGDELYVNVSHSALILELQPILDTLRSRINQKFSPDFCSKVTLTYSGTKH